MKKWKTLSFLAALCASFQLSAQTRYQAGFASVSLEPSENIFSVALQGYGAPAEGRFSLEWADVGTLGEVAHITGLGNYLYALTPDGDLNRTDATRQPLEWTNIGATNPVVLLAGATPDSFKLIASLGETLYAVSLDNRLSRYDTTVFPMKWISVGRTPNAVAIASAKEKLFIADAAGTLWQADPNSRELCWDKCCDTGFDAVSMTSQGNRLYLLARDQRLWEYTVTDAAPEWSPMAYINGVTYRKPLAHIAVAGGRLFGAGLDNTLYRSQHRTEENLQAACLTLTFGKSTVAVIAADLCAVEYRFTQKIKDTIAARYGLPHDAILFNLSHSHFTPVSRNWFPFGRWAYPDERYLDQVADNIVKCVGEALENRRESQVHAYRTESRIGLNRSLHASDAPYDPTVDIVKIVPADGTAPVVVFSAACHPVFPNAGESRYTISANFVGTARRIIEERTGTHAMFLQGCAGDTNPVSQDYHATGETLAQDVIHALEEKMVPVSGKITYRLDSIGFGIEVPAQCEIERFAWENENRSMDIEAEKNVRWARWMLKRYAEGDIPESSAIYLQTVRIGDWQIVGLSDEPVCEFAFAVRHLYPKLRTTVLGYCNEVSRYLPGPEHIANGTYEALSSYYWYGQPAAAPATIMDLVLEKLKKEMP